MTQRNEWILETIKLVSSEIRTLGPDEREALSDLESALDAAEAELDDRTSQLAELLGLSRQGMRALAHGAQVDFDGLADAILGGMVTAEQLLTSELDPMRATLARLACDALRSALPAAPSREAREEVGARTADVEPVAEEEMAFNLLPDDHDPELMAEFITECRDYIQKAEVALLSLETNPDDDEAVNTVFRAFHTIKGTAGFVGIDPVAKVAHHAESLLSRIRDHEIRCTGGYADLSLRSVDALKDLMQALQDALAGDVVETPEGLEDLLRLLADPEAAGITGEPSVDGDLAVPRLGDILVAEGRAGRADVEATAAGQGERLLGEALVQSGVASAGDVARALRTQKRLAADDRTAESSVRVRTDRLDRLINIVGELVIADSMVSQDAVVISGGHLDLVRKVNHTSKIVRELQDLTMSMRMVPLKATFQKMARLVRDLGQKSKKAAEFITEGEETEIDRNMVDILNDPLVHMIRNAMDHGIEPPEEREWLGKPRKGSVWLSAYYQGSNVVVEVRDDGRGLNREKIVEKALARGLIESEKGLSDSAVFTLIFEPGFSTAEQVTDISGRGVGMDVVKRAIDSLRGRIEIASAAGEGTTFKIRLPITLALTDGMLVKVGRERYIIPTLNISMSFRPALGALFTVADRGELVMFRDDLMPIIRLHRLFHVVGAVEDPALGLLVIVDDGRNRCALLVDELLGQQQVVAKSLGGSIGKAPGISGGAILGDGRVGLILDPFAIIALAGQGGNTNERIAHLMPA